MSAADPAFLIAAAAVLALVGWAAVATARSERKIIPGPDTAELEALEVSAPAGDWDWPEYPVSRERAGRTPRTAHLVRGSWTTDNRTKEEA